MDQQIRNNKSFISIILYLVLAGGLFACGNEAATSRIDVTSFPEYPSQQLDLYLQKCGACHGAPLPSIHKAKMWSSVLHRMQMRMVSKKVVPLSESEMSTILDYLQRNAK